MNISIDEEKASDKIQHRFMIKKKIDPPESGHRGQIPKHNNNYLQLTSCSRVKS